MRRRVVFADANATHPVNAARRSLSLPPSTSGESGVSPEKDQTFPRTAINLSLHYTREGEGGAGGRVFLESRLIKIVITTIAGRYSSDNKCRGYPRSFPEGQKYTQSYSYSAAVYQKRTCYFSASSSSTRPLRYQPMLEQSYGIKNAGRCGCILVSSEWKLALREVSLILPLVAGKVEIKYPRVLPRENRRLFHDEIVISPGGLKSGQS